MINPMTRLIAIAGICASLGLAACGDDDDDATTGAAETTETTTEAAEATEADEAVEETAEAKPEKPDKPGITIKTGDSQFGEILFNDDDQAIYLFDLEKSDASECYDDCAVEWPPVITKGDPEAKGGADQGLLGTTKRDDGQTQVTYNGHPLYYYFNEGPGEVLCHNVPGFGGLWLVVDPNGDAV